MVSHKMKMSAVPSKPEYSMLARFHIAVGRYRQEANEKTGLPRTKLREDVKLNELSQIMEDHRPTHQYFPHAYLSLYLT